MFAPMVSAGAIPGAASWRMKVRVRPETALADTSRRDASGCKLVQPSFPVDGVVSETSEGDMMNGQICSTLSAIPRANSKKDDIAMRERIRLFCRRVSRCKEGRL